jgi:transposase-like protein
VADIKSEPRPASNRNRWPASYWNAWPASSESATNAIEAPNSKLRRAVRARGHFPSDEAAMKLLFLVLNGTEKEWTMPPREWSLAKAHFAILFGERFARAMA